MKAYTDLEQSRKLAEILPIESADMRYTPFGDTHPWVWDGEVKLLEKDSVPCWSLGTLLDAIHEVSLNSYKDGNWNVMIQHDGKMIYADKDNPVDACYEMIIKLNEMNLL